MSTFDVKFTVDGVEQSELVEASNLKEAEATARAKHPTAEIVSVDECDEAEDVEELLETAWGLIANAHDGDWNKAPREWREAAERFRDRWNAHNEESLIEDDEDIDEDDEFEPEDDDDDDDDGL